MASIEESISRLNKDVKRLDEKTRKTDKKVDELDDSIAFNEDDISDLKKNAKAAELELEKWRKEILYFEAYSRRENVKSFGIKENSESSEGDVSTHPENTKDIIYNFMEQELKIGNARHRITFQRIHRLGKPNTNGSCPIIARFLRYSDKEEVMSKARQHLKGKDFFVYDDIPKELYDLRKKQQKKFQDALSKGYKAHFSKVHPDQLFINDKYIAPDTPLE